MTDQQENTALGQAVELLIQNRSDGVATPISILMNAAIKMGKT